MVKKIINFSKKNIVMFIAMLVAITSTVFVPFDKQYASYFDYRTLTCLFCTLAVVCAFTNIDFFYIVACKIVEKFKTTRKCILSLVIITFIGSMLLANDMALLTFLPLGFYVLSTTNKPKYMAFTFIMQNIAANLGGMLTPFGNPQNLYLFSKFNIPTIEFMQIMFLPFLLATILIIVCCLCVKSEQMTVTGQKKPLNTKRTIIYSVLFIFAVSVVFRIIPYQIGLIVIPVSLFFLDKNALKKVDYPLLLTFVFFFVFAGNISRIPQISEFLSQLLQKDTLFYSTLSCQFISNVPSAILLSQFTNNYPALLVGVNIGGTGTLIASLASLITFREYTKHNKGKTGKYILLFSAFNFGFLIVMFLFSKLILNL